MILQPILMVPAKSPSTSSLLCGHLFDEVLNGTGRKINGGTKVSVKKAKLSESNGKRAHLCLSAQKKERIKIPTYGDVVGGTGVHHISHFFSHPSGTEAILNTRALKSYHPLDTNLYRCILPQVQLFNFRVAPVVDLQVTPTSKDCVVEMLSCKLEGSEVVERQNEHFSAYMKNCIKWETIDTQEYLDVDVRLNLVLEIYTRPFTLLPISAIEGPGNIMMQSLVDRLVPLLLRQLLQDYEEWIHQNQKAMDSTKDPQDNSTPAL